MSDRALNRRDFLRLSLVLAGGAFIATCDEVKLELTPTKEVLLKSGIRLNGGEADAWVFRKSVSGRLDNPAVCQAVLVDNSNTRVNALIEGSSFSAEVPIRPGENPVIGVCKQTNEEEELSTQINFTGR